MAEADVEFVAFPHVRVIEVAAQALFCAIEGRRVWLPRRHIKGDLLCRGDFGPLSIRRWVALDRHLRRASPREAALIGEGASKARLPGRLHLVQRGEGAPHGH